MFINGFLSREDFDKARKFSEGLGNEQEVTIKLIFLPHTIMKEAAAIIPVSIDLGGVNQTQITFAWNQEDGHYGIITIKAS